ncbi:MAG: hypothetical protein KDI06_10990 [Calditrichaeota bacterium]|nr:hypothetical protein [Calditrichota bacterium]HQU72633.1 hypothetical protein [Calditrichia bacterium]
MAWQVDWDGKFVVGGEARTRLTPNFRLREFQDGGGRVRVHRELVSAIQLLRSSFGGSVGIAAVEGDGLGADLTSDNLAGLFAAAERIAGHRLFSRVDNRETHIAVRIPDPEQLPEIDLEQALETAFSVTAGFETSGDRFQQVTGNFDGAGFSFGPAQWNFGTSTLPPLFEAFRKANPETYRACFTDPEDFEEWEEVLTMSSAEQVAWANQRSTGRNNGDVVEPWKGYLQAVGRVEQFRAIMVEESLRKYGAKLLETVGYLQSLAPGIAITHLRCICSLYDLVIQQGSLSRAKTEIEDRVKREKPADQYALVRLAVEERGRKANPRFQADCVSRRLGILNGVPTTIEEHQRANIHFYMLRDVHVRPTNLADSEDLSDRLAKIGRVIASGDSLLT